MPSMKATNTAAIGGSVSDAEPRFLAVSFERVAFSYRGVPVLHDACFHVHEGEFAVLVGPNGAGKTTILRLILGLAEAASGRVLVLGESPASARASVGYVPQHASYDPAFPISVEEVVRMGRLQGAWGRYKAADAGAVTRALGLAGVEELRRRPYNALSGGQRRRVLVARALAAEPRFLILDEPTANMDAESERRLYGALGDIKGKATILVVTHDTGYVSALADAVLCVGEHTGAGRGVVRHAAAPTNEAPGERFAGGALRVLHDVALPPDSCCGGHEAAR